MAVQTSLSLQLKKLKTPQTTALKEVKGRVSFLYDLREAGSIDCDTHYAVALSGFKALLQVDPLICSFHQTLFDESMKTFERGQQNKQDNQDLNLEIKKFLYQIVSPYFLLSSTHKVLEWLVYRFRIHEFNTDELIISLLPYHETRLFVRVVQLCKAPKDSTSKWSWLKPIQIAGVPITKSVLHTHCLSDLGFLKLICNATIESVELSNSVNPFTSFSLSTIVCVIEKQLDDDLVKLILRHIYKSLKSKNVSLFTTSFIVTSMIVSKIELLDDVILKLMLKMANSFNKSVHKDLVIEDFLMTLELITRSQNVKILSSEVVDCIPIDSFVSLFSKINLTNLSSAVISRLVMDHSNENSYEKLMQLLKKLDCDEISIKSCLEAIANVMTEGNTNRELLCNILEILERRYSTIFDNMLDEVSNEKLDDLLRLFRHKLVPNTGIRLSLALKHPSSNIRINSLDHIKRNIENMSEDESKEVLNYLVDAFPTEITVGNHEILKIYVELFPNLEKLIPQKIMISYCKDMIELCNLKIKAEENDTNIWNKLKENSLEYLCSLQYASEKDFLSVISEHLLPLDTHDIKCTRKIIGSKAAQSFDLFEGLKLKKGNNLGSFVDDFARELAFKYSKNENMLIDFLFEHKHHFYNQALLGLFVTYYALQTCKDATLFGKLSLKLVNMLRFIMKHHKLRTKELNNANNFIDLYNSNHKYFLKREFTLKFVRSCVEVLLSNMIYPDTKPDWILTNQHNANYLINFFKLLCELSSHKNSKVAQEFKTFLVDFCKNCYKNLGISYFACFWTQVNNPLLQSRSLLCCKQILNHKTSLSQFDTIPLLVALVSPSNDIRQAAILLMDKLDCSKCSLLKLIEINKDVVLSSQMGMAEIFLSWYNDYHELPEQLKKNHVDWSSLISKILSNENTTDSAKFGLSLVTIKLDSYSYALSLIPTMTKLVKLIDISGLNKYIAYNILNNIMLSMKQPEVNSPDNQIVQTFLATLHSKNIVDHLFELVNLKWFDNLLNFDIKMCVIENFSNLIISKNELARKKLKKLLKNGKLVAAVVNKLTNNSIMSSSSPKKRRIENRIPFSAENQSWIKVMVIFEILLSKPKFDNASDVMDTTFNLLEECLITEEQVSLEYLRQLLLSTIINCLDQKFCDLKRFKIALLFDILRQSRHKETQKLCLTCINRVAMNFKEDIMHSIMLVFGFLGTNVLHCDDNLSQKVIDDTLEAILPSILDENEETRNKVIDTFVDALPDIPTQRRIYLFKKLIELLDPSKTLWLIVYKLNFKAIENKTNSFADFSSLLSMKFDGINQLKTINKLLTSVKHINQKNIENMKGSSTSTFETSNQDFVLKLVYTLIQIISSDDFVREIAHLQWENIKKQMGTFLDSLLEVIDDTIKAIEKQKKTEYLVNLKNQLYKLINKVNDLLPNKKMIQLVILLLSRDSISVKKKALELLNQKLTEDKANELSLKLIETLFEPLLSIIHSMKKMEANNVVIAQLTLLVLKILSKKLEKFDESKDYLESMLKCVLSSITDVEASISVNYMASAFLCLTQLAVSLGNHSLPYIPSLMKIIVNNLKNRTEIVLLSCLSSLAKITQHFSLFMSPYLHDILIKFCDVKSFELKDKKIELKANAIKSNMASLIPLRTLVNSFDGAFDELSEHSLISLCELLIIAKDALSRGEKAELEALMPHLQTFIFKALDYRNKNYRTKDLNDIEQVEKCAINVIIAFVPKLSEITFRPFFYKLHDWATKTKEEKMFHRIITFYNVTNQLADTLRSLFCAFAAPFIVADCISLLNLLNVANKPFNVDNTTAHQILNNVLLTVSKCFLYDINGSFGTKERIFTLMDPIVNQISNEFGTKQEYELRINVGVKDCIISLLRKLEDGNIAKDLHNKILLKTRDSSSMIRLSALQILHQLILTMNEEYLPLLPEAIPFFAELFEEDGDDIQKMLHVLFNDAEQICGEPITKYF